MLVRSVRFCSGSFMLEGRLAAPDGPARAGVVLCHPHPLFQGSMSSALVPALQRALTPAGFVVLRFNFRGVGRSEGSFSGGVGETDDAMAALDLLATELPLATALVSAGWSFGSLVALRAALRHPKVAAAVAIAPPLEARPGVPAPDAPSPESVRRWARPVLAVAGERDDISPPEPIRTWARQSGAELSIVPGADHFFADPAAVGRTMLTFLRRHGVG